MIQAWAALALLTSATVASAQEDLLDDEPAAEESAGESEPTAPLGAEGADDAPPDEGGTTEGVAPSPAETAAQGGTATSLGAAADVDTQEADADVASTAHSAEATAATTAPSDWVIGSSHVRRMRLMPDGALILDGPLATDLQDREYLQTRRQLGGVALPDTTAALGHSNLGGAGTSLLQMRLQPTLVLLNGRRLVSAPYFGASGADYVDINQLPIQLIERVEFVKGISAGLYGDSAIGGVANFVTRRNYQGIEVDVGAQSTDKFDQTEGDVALTIGAGSEKTGVNVMVSYFNRGALAATDRDWIGERDERVKSLLGSPASFQPLMNLLYPFADPYCDLATKQGYADGVEVRIRGYGPPETLGQISPDVRNELLMNGDSARGNNNGVLEAGETDSYCSGNFTPAQDLVLSEERIQTYSTFWHKFSDHTQAFGELGYYRSDNENRTAPSFPINRLTPDVNDITPVWVPNTHSDQPYEHKGFAAVEVANGRVPATEFLVGRVAGLYAGSNVNKRRTDVYRGVLGLNGDLKDAAAGSALESWDWELTGTYSGSESVSRVHDVLMDKLVSALNSCPATKLVNRVEVPTTIKERQEMGCFNPFYSSVTNNAALDPFNVSNAQPSSSHGFITTDTDPIGKEGYGVQDGGYICDPNDPNSPPCPPQFDVDGNAAELAGTPNTKQVIDRLMGEQITVQRRTLATADALLRGDIAEFAGGGLSFGLGGQFRRETLDVDYDAAYNQRLYGFLFGGDDIPNASRNVGAAFAELRLRLLNGLIELQPAARIEYYETVGTAFNPMVGLALRPFAAGSSPPPALEWLLLRGHIGRGHRAPSLQQMYGAQTEFESVDFFGSTSFVPHEVRGNPDLDFEKYTTISGGLQWDFAGIHVGADFWTTQIDGLIAGDNSKTLISDCVAQYQAMNGNCREQVLLTMTRILDRIESPFDNIANVSTNGIDGAVSYTLDSKKRSLGDFGTFVIGATGTFINSYLIDSPRALREYYRDGDQLPVFNMDGTRNYSNLTATYEAAGYRNRDNFAPPIPRLRFAVPLRWLYDGHVAGVTMRYIGSYNDDSEDTVEHYGLPNINDLYLAEGETIPAWTVFDANYGYTFRNDGWQLRFMVGVINILDTAPPPVESPLGYEVGVHDPRGRTFFARVTGAF